ncbi:hypothetical protein [Celeribacter indicus]|uniref:hypothetical protein n=1 Tax=Celeribacter indicus TaxID=1208324 RepID=UPI001C31ABCD|nr:hypothetical protein [Celeribacter indicus]
MAGNGFAHVAGEVEASVGLIAGIRRRQFGGRVALCQLQHCAAAIHLARRPLRGKPRISVLSGRVQDPIETVINPLRKRRGSVDAAGDIYLPAAQPPDRLWPVPICRRVSISNGQLGQRAMADFEVHVDLNGCLHPVGLARSNRVRGNETILFEYDPAWLKDAERFSLEPSLTFMGPHLSIGHNVAAGRNATRGPALQS